jgi:DNA-binding CsgD family transcriptional regulator
VREEGRHVRGNGAAANKNESVIDSVVEKPLLSLHSAMDVNSFWKAVQQVLSAAMPNHVIGLALQHNPALPMIARWTQPMPKGFFAAEPLESYVTRPPHKKFVRISGLFRNRRSFVKSAFYRRYMAPKRCAHGVGLFFWKRQRLICVLAILRTATQGDFLPAEMRLLRQLYPQFQTALRRLGSLEREHSVRMDFEEFLNRLPMPTILLRWNLKLIYQNRAAREFCAVWEKGPEEAKRTKATSPIPSEILDRCRVLKRQWVDASRANTSQTSLEQAQVHHQRLPHLRATIHLKQLKAAGVARPHFLIRCENLCPDTARSAPANSYLPALVGLTRREQEVAQLVCQGRSNQEVADNARLSLPMVKKHLHAVFRKLEVPSRTRLVALMP